MSVRAFSDIEDESTSEMKDGEPEIVRKVLVVDDSRLQRRILSAQLRRWGYEVIEASSGDEALSICHHDPPDIVLSDWMMPGMSGLDFCRQFRALDRETYGYFILLTSKSEKGEVARGLDVGADDFLSKPVNGSELRARIHAGERILRMERELTRKNRMGRARQARALRHRCIGARDNLRIDDGAARLILFCHCAGSESGSDFA